MYKNIFQQAWITNDLERAVEVFRKEQGIENWGIYPNFELQSADPENPLVIDVALCYVGDMQFEIIDPVSGPIQHYTRHLPESEEFTLKYHHMCSEIKTDEDYDRIINNYRERGVPIEVEGKIGETGRYFYANTYDMVNHYQEYALLDPAVAESLLASLPRN